MARLRRLVVRNAGVYVLWERFAFVVAVVIIFWLDGLYTDALPRRCCCFSGSINANDAGGGGSSFLRLANQSQRSMGTKLGDVGNAEVVKNEEEEKSAPSFATTATTNTKDPRVEELKRELLSLSALTQRGFRATRAQDQRVKDIAKELTRYRTGEPASCYYPDAARTTTPVSNTLEGKWTLIYTNAPDITGLDSPTNPWAELGRIGQDCTQRPYIKNVIEWKRPSWIPAWLDRFEEPDEQSRGRVVLQKVVTQARATREKPFAVDLQLVGLELEGKDDGGGASAEGWEQWLRGPSAWLAQNPELKGFLTAPFGQFQILYLDEEFRIIRTNQNFLAINARITSPSEEWF